MSIFSRQKSAKKCAFFCIFRKKWCTPPNAVFTEIAKKMGVTTPGKAARKTCLQGRLSPGKKPANLYSTKCRFFAASPYRGSQCTECTPSGESSRPRLDHTGEGSPTPPAKKKLKIFFSKYFFYNLKKNILKNFFIKIFFRISYKRNPHFYEFD